MRWHRVWVPPDNVYKQLNLKEVPVVRVEGLSEAKKRAFVLADNKLAEHAGWNRAQLAIELPELSDVLIAEGLDITVTGFAVAEVDQIVVDLEDANSDRAQTRLAMPRRRRFHLGGS